VNLNPCLCASPLQFSLDRFPDECGSAVVAGDRVDTGEHVRREPNGHGFQIERRASHARLVSGSGFCSQENDTLFC